MLPPVAKTTYCSHVCLSSVVDIVFVIAVTVTNSVEPFTVVCIDLDSAGQSVSFPSVPGTVQLNFTAKTALGEGVLSSLNQ